jgi:hypothetical protein
MYKLFLRPHPTWLWMMEVQVLLLSNDNGQISIRDNLWSGGNVTGTLERFATFG